MFELFDRHVREKNNSRERTDRCLAVMKSRPLPGLHVLNSAKPTHNPATEYFYSWPQRRRPTAPETKTLPLPVLVTRFFLARDSCILIIC